MEDSMRPIVDRVERVFRRVEKVSDNETAVQTLVPCGVGKCFS
jgi:hypothetical protein